ncbi:MAG: radical SAM protein [Coprobacillus sp.]
MERSSYLIKPASSLCNMNCKYCFYSDVSHNRSDYSKGIMKKDVVDILIEKALNESQNITFAFQGGEPTVAGIEYFKYFINKVNQEKKDHTIEYAIQTNGLLIDKEWIEIFKENNFLVGVSLDGYKSNHESIRLKQGEGTFDQVMNTLYLLKQNEIDYNVLTVVTSSLAKYPKQVYEFFKDNEIDHIQFIPCLPELDQSTQNYELKPKEFYSFYKGIYELWKEDISKGKMISISLFDNLAMLFKGIYPHTCGMLGQCQLQMIIEADGSIYPCDFYALDKYKLGNIVFDEISEIRKSQVLHQFLKEEKNYCKLCKHCKFYKVCQGNCKRMNIVYFDENYCGYQQFLEETYKEFYNL